MPNESLGEEYVRLALSINQHIPGYVDAYMGPTDWYDQAKTEGPLPLPELTRKADNLAATIATDGSLDAQRKDFLTRHVFAMQTSLHLLQGEKIALEDEVEALYDIRPTWIDEKQFEEAHRVLDNLLPAGKTLRDRMTRHNQGLEMSVEKAKEVLPWVCQYFRELSSRGFPLPTDETFEIEFVQNQPWGAYHWYLGRCQSRIEINTDLPIQVNHLADLVAHEGYPGHHTELSIKETQLLQQARQIEWSVVLLNTPSSIVSEGIATCALSAILPDQNLSEWYAEELFPRTGFHHLDAQREHSIYQARKNLGGVSSNAAFLLHDQGVGMDQVNTYLQHFSLCTEKEARKIIEFMSDPLFRSYIFTYYWGKQLLNSLFTTKQALTPWFTRLLTETVTPSWVRQWILS